MRTDPQRRRFLRTGLGLAALGAAGMGIQAAARTQLMNPCRAALPLELAKHEIVRAAWAGLDAAQVVDVHAHLAGSGDGGSGITISPRMLSPLYPMEYLQRLFYLNAGCAHDDPGRVDASFVDRLHNLAEGMAPGFRLLLFAFDRAYDEAGTPLPDRTAFHVPNIYARQVARRDPQHFEWACSVHPYRADCVEALEAAKRDGARAIKWLPPAMGIDPASPKCDRFYEAAARLRLPLISHGGEEKAVHGHGSPAFGNVLRLRRALDHGVPVIVAHCATLGEDTDLDRGAQGRRVPSFALFSRLMDDPRYTDRLFGDISAITLRNRDTALLRAVIERTEWHSRLLYGSDYPLPGILPLMSPASLARDRMLDAAAAPVLEHIREHNPLLFDFVLKRHLVSNGKRFAPCVFESRRLLDRLSGQDDRIMRLTAAPASPTTAPQP